MNEDAGAKPLDLEGLRAQLARLCETDPAKIERETKRATALAKAIEKLTLVTESLGPAHRALAESDPDSPAERFLRFNLVSAHEAFQALVEIAQNSEFIRTQETAVAAHQYARHKSSGGSTT